jgi:polyisoprenoid-binding protein YceI
VLAVAPACTKDSAKKSDPAPTAPTAQPAQPAGQDPPTTPATEPARVTPPAAGAAIPAGTYEIDPGHSALIWRARHFDAGYTYGWFRDFKGSFVVDADASKGSVELTAQIASVDSALPKRDDHLRSPDFFNAEQFPTLTFKSTKIEPAGATLRVTGDLSLHGVTKSLTTDVTPLGSGVDPMNATRAGYEAHLTLKRSDFGMKFMLPGVGDDIDLTLAFEGVKQ